jgi:hypothetical protein
MIYAHTMPRTAIDTANADLGPHDPIPPEAWRYCGGVAHLVKRRVVQDGRQYRTVAECAKCGQGVERIAHPVATPGKRL